MNLCIDIGNTLVKAYLADKEAVKLSFLKEDWQKDFKQLLQLIEKHRIKNGILSSTRDDNKGLLQTLEETLDVFIYLDNKTPVPIQNAYGTPETLGRDRLAVVVAAQHLFPDEHCLVIDAGTCITYDFITSGKKYLGGSIAPGLRLRFKALNAFTDRLPLVEPAEVEDFIGNSTKTSILTGVVEGCIAELEGRILQYDQYFGEIKVLLTGGDGPFFEKRLKNEIFADSNLLPIGLNTILEYNLDQKL